MSEIISDITSAYITRECPLSFDRNLELRTQLKENLGSERTRSLGGLG